jgi:hypothetical protein
MRSALLFLAGLGAMLAAGWTGFPKALYVSRPQPLQFNHKVHADKAGLECSGCHEMRADGRFSGIPGIANCAGCHTEAQGTTAAEKQLVKDFVTPNREIPWRVYSRQPINARFSHVHHVKTGKLTCESCHGDHGKSTALRPYLENRISGYSKVVDGTNLMRAGLIPGDGMRMSDCERCHQQRGVRAGCLGCHQ